MRVVAILVLALCSAGCHPTPAKHPAPTAPPAGPSVVTPSHTIDVAVIRRPASSTAAQIRAQMSVLKFPGAAHPDGNPALGSTWTLDISHGEISPFDGSFYLDTILYLGLPDDVYFNTYQPFADFAIHPTGTIEPNVQIEATASPSKSLLIDCRVDRFTGPANMSFQFEQGNGPWGGWTNKSVVTPSNGHVFYGISSAPADSWGVLPYTYIRLQPTPETTAGGAWQFFGCDLTFGP